MNYQTIIFILLFLLFFLSLLIWAIIELSKQTKKDWDTIEELKKKANQVSSKEEIEEFHKEFIEKASKIYTTYNSIELQRIDAYLRGLYKQFKT